MTTILFYSFLVSLLLGTTLTPFLILGVNKIGGLDQPGLRKVHKEPISRIGGVAFALGAIIAMGLLASPPPGLFGILLGSFMIFCVGVLDDYMDLRVRFKLFGQLLAAGVVATLGQLSWQPFSIILNQDLPEWLMIPLIMILLTAFANAVNFSDGLDGLAGGLSFLSFGMVSYIAYEIQDNLVLYLTLPVLGGLLGFLRFNTYPARVFMGDGGSQFLGFLLGIICLLLSDSTRSPLSPLLGFFIIGLPLLDMIAVTAQRVMEKRSPFQADQNHLHHKIMALGFSHHQVVLIMYLLQIGLASSAYLLRWESMGTLATLYTLILMSLGLFYYLIASGRLQPGMYLRLSQKTLHWRTWIHARPGIASMSLKGLGAGILTFLSLGLFEIRAVPKEIAYSAIGLVTLFFLGRIIYPQISHLLNRMILYLGGSFILYLLETNMAETTWQMQLIIQGFFVIMAMLLLLAIHLDAERRFNPNPMDYLLIFFAFAIPVLPEIRVGNINLSVFMGQLIILFFSCEVLIQAFPKKVQHLGLVLSGVLLIIALQAWW